MPKRVILRLDPRTLFLYGLLDGHGGTCVTMPILYVAIGRRLEYPLYLVQAREHFFVRWEEGGERFNIEATTLGFSPRDDDHFLRWPKPIRHEDVRLGLFLRNLEPHEERAAFLRERGQCWLDHLRTDCALEAFSEALALRPRLPGLDCAFAISTVIHHIVEEAGREAVLRMSLSDLQLQLLDRRWELELRSLVLEQLQRIVYNYRERQNSLCPVSKVVLCPT